MYQPLLNLENKIKTKTDLILMLEDPDNPNGKFEKRVEVTVSGTMTVSIQNMIEVDANSVHLAHFNNTIANGNLPILIWQVTQMDQEGESELGTVKVNPNDFSKTWGTIRPKEPNALTPFPAILEAEVCAQFTIENIGTLRNLTPVPIRAEVVDIPPFGIEAKHQNSAILVDENDQPRGMIVGRSITLEGPADI